MDAKDLITLLLGIYAAVLSTYLGVRELRREARTLSIFLTYIAYYEAYTIMITNSGHRPITITSVEVIIPEQGAMKASLIMQHNQDLYFPFMLNDGQTVTVNLPPYVCEKIADAKEDIGISVYDSEGRIYDKYKTTGYNPKSGGYFPR